METEKRFSQTYSLFRSGPEPGYGAFWGCDQIARTDHLEYHEESRVETNP